MALGFGAAVLNGTLTKIFTVTCLDTDAAGNLAVDFTTAGMTDLPVAPIDYHVTVIGGAAGVIPTQWAITAVAADGVTVRLAQIGGGGAGATITVRVVCRVISAIDR